MTDSDKVRGAGRVRYERVDRLRIFRWFAVVLGKRIVVVLRSRLTVSWQQQLLLDGDESLGHVAYEDIEWTGRYS